MYSKWFWRYEFISSDFFLVNVKITFFNIVTLTFDLWPLTFTYNLGMVHIHHHAKFGDPRSNGSGDINFFLVFVTDGQTDG